MVFAMRSKAVLLPCAVLACISLAPMTFTGIAQSPTRTNRVVRHAGAFLPLELVEPAVTSYVEIWTPMFKAAVESGLAPDFLVHWGHGAAMGTVLVAMGGYGTFLGWQVRFGNGAVEYPLTLGKTAKEMHPLLMGGALFMFLLGGQGGLILLATQGQPILQSAHSSTAVLGLGLMAIQASLGLTMGNAPEKRTVHAFAGTAIMVLLSVHMYFGLNLGNSF
ncbi:unnamed protein product [Polarella glacialis]|uniref:Cytochrome b561 domain-containing protein n=1 Tax=Polarella glacialis TaxID=89957 RepID=A0A813G5D9_POLGL|nr:unnamed protein product [Polarella glacialis]CAE8702270.1 unnamed protein product [Polarella glacialis]